MKSNFQKSGSPYASIIKAENRRRARQRADKRFCDGALMIAGVFTLVDNDGVSDLLKPDTPRYI